jgi:hypothetical protein
MHKWAVKTPLFANINGEKYTLLRGKSQFRAKYKRLHLQAEQRNARTHAAVAPVRPPGFRRRDVIDQCHRNENARLGDLFALPDDPYHYGVCRASRLVRMDRDRPRPIVNRAGRCLFCADMVERADRTSARHGGRPGGPSLSCQMTTCETGALQDIAPVISSTGRESPSQTRCLTTNDSSLARKLGAIDFNL